MPGKVDDDYDEDDMFQRMEEAYNEGGDNERKKGKYDD